LKVESYTHRKYFDQNIAKSIVLFCKAGIFYFYLFFKETIRLQIKKKIPCKRSFFLKKGKNSQNFQPEIFDTGI